MSDKDYVICYLDDDDSKKEIYTSDVEVTNNYVKFRTNRNYITIPWFRIRKLKLRGINNE